MLSKESMPEESNLADRFSQFEARLTRLEAHLGLEPVTPESPLPQGPPADGESDRLETPLTGDELEVVVGQNWFAGVGIIVLALGGAFALSLPFPNLPALAPSLIGYLVAIGLFLVARFWNESFRLVARYLRGAGMALLFFATLRLFFFGTPPALRTDSWVGGFVLLLSVGVNVGLALHRRSPVLLGLALTTGYAAVVAVGSAGFAFLTLTALTLLTIVVCLRSSWTTGILLFGIVGTLLTHLVWALNDPLLGNPVRLLGEPQAGLWCLLGYMTLFATASLLRRDRSAEDAQTVVAAVLNCGLGYGIFLVHSVAVFHRTVAVNNVAAALLFLGVAAAFWVRERSHASTFVYAMTGYAALGVALLARFHPPNVFVWLSLESVLVVATALWFRSRFIVVANFLAYLTIVLAYGVTRDEERGVSIGFGLVALVTARILNWQRRRLELKTDLMRNAYLASAFVIFPYALYHLLPRAYVAASWVGVAVTYYVLNLVIHNRKYRWMGHLTLLLTACYLVGAAITQLEPRFRILSFLLLGSVLLFVSLIFTFLQTRKTAGSTARAGERMPGGSAPPATGPVKPPEDATVRGTVSRS